VSSAFNVEQLTIGRGLAQWPALHTTTGETEMSKRDQILAVFKPGASLNKADIARSSGVDIGMVGYYLKQLVDEGKLAAAGATGDRRFALAGTGASTGSAPPPKGAKTTRKGTAGKRAKKKRVKAEATPAPAPAAACNVTPFTPAMTTDKRMVVVGGSEPLMFSVEQTQSIADLIFGNFEAS
jgi:hypothetical protein